MEAKSIYDALWAQGVQPEIVSFLSSLNWTFIIMFITILYGIKRFAGLFSAELKKRNYELDTKVI